jgi:hypothetical protein
MLADIVKNIIAPERDIDVAGEIAGHGGLLQEAARVQADFIVLGGTLASEDDDYRELLYGRPRMKILAITADGRRGFLHELQPRALALGEISSTSLIDAIRRASQTAGAAP